MQQYAKMNLQSPAGTMYGEHSELGAAESGMEATGLAHSDSMDVNNDPRFFQDNVLNYRLTAFAGVGVVCGLMVQNAMDHLFAMRKTMNVEQAWNIDQVFQHIAFAILTVVLFLNMVGTYVGVAQPYHTIRLMTAGPTGLECAALYYLNKNIATWRHFAVHGALLSLPMFILSSAFRMVVKFDWDNEELPGPAGAVAPVEDRIIGYVSMATYQIMALTVYYIHRKHRAVFEERYEMVKPTLYQHGEALDIMTPRPTDRNTSRSIFRN